MTRRRRCCRNCYQESLFHRNEIKNIGGTVPTLAGGIAPCIVQQLLIQRHVPLQGFKVLSLITFLLHCSRSSFIQSYVVGTTRQL